MSIILLNLIMISLIILFLLILYLYNRKKEVDYIKKCSKEKENLIIRFSGDYSSKNALNNPCLISVRLKDKNLMYNDTVFKKCFGIGPEYIFIENFHRTSNLNKALDSFLKDYGKEFDKEYIKV